jgi:DNA primase
MSEETLIQAGLALRREGGEARGVYDRFRQRLMIPLIAPGGAVVGFGARALGDENPKYLNSPETAVYHKSSFLFGLEQARRALTTDGELIVVEGYFDVITLHQAGIVQVVATSGTALTADHAHAFRRLVLRVALTFDGDRAGREATMRSIGILLAEGLEVRVVDLPPGEDPDTLVRRAWVEGWNERRAAAYDAVEFVHRHVLGAALKAGAARADALERAIQAIVGLAAGLADPVRSADAAALRQCWGGRGCWRGHFTRRRGQFIETPVGPRASTGRRGPGAPAAAGPDPGIANPERVRQRQARGFSRPPAGARPVAWAGTRPAGERTGGRWRAGCGGRKRPDGLGGGCAAPRSDGRTTSETAAQGCKLPAR